MKKTIYAAVAVALLASSAALAADIPRGPYYAQPAATSSVFNWTGAYAGANVGYQWGGVTNNPTNPSGVAGGLQGGYNWQTGQFVFGGEADIQISGAEDTFAPWKFSNPWFGTVRARGGFALNNILFYGTVGLAYGDIRAETAGLSETHTSVGWAGGGGVEVALNPVWTARAEYLYVDLDNRLFNLTGVRNGYWSNLIRFGVNYRF